MKGDFTWERLQLAINNTIEKVELRNKIYSLLESLEKVGVAAKRALDGSNDEKKLTQAFREIIILAENP